MGRAWKMPLLSTLAALVILVHSAEEDYRRDVSARMAGPPAPLYDQAWRAVEIEPIAQETTQEGKWGETSSEEMPRRRRKYNRKPKRRPQADLQEETEDSAPHAIEIDVQQRSHPDNDPTTSENSERPRRRRKRPEMMDNRWLEKPLDSDRPLRRRGQRRKRPLSKYRPKLVEENDAVAIVGSADAAFTDEQPNNGDQADSALEINTHDESKLDNKEYFTDHNEGQAEHESQLSTEIASQPIFDIAPTITADDNTIAETVRKVKSKEPIDPHTLKEILRKSNGSSLSEILQQNNLSLSDLLRARDNTISSGAYMQRGSSHDIKSLEEKRINKQKFVESDDSDSEIPLNPVVKDVQETTTTTVTPEILDTNEDAPKILQRRRLPPGTVRRRLRLKSPMNNYTMKFPVSRESSVLNTRKQALLKRLNETARISEEKYVTTVKVETEPPVTTTTEGTTTTTTTTETLEDDNTTEYIPITTTDLVEDFDFKSINADTIEPENIEEDVETVTTEIPEPITTTTEKPLVISNIRSKALNTSELRRQALTNRLKRKRLKQKNATTESPVTDVPKDLFGMTNLVSAAEFIAKMQTSKVPDQNTKEISNSIDESLVTEATTRIEKTERNTKQYTRKTTEMPVTTTTEETAKIEIEEILNDRNTGARLSRILKERNMTLEELVEHRERGSSHVHLADIFHNASREPNPPEPFLSKSSIEPLAKETYPLRVLLEANLHDPAVKPTTADASPTMHTNIPVVMDFRNNVNENSDNLGIMSLFNKLTTNDINLDDSNVRRDSQGAPYVTSVVSVGVPSSTESNREARRLEQPREMVTLQDIFSILHGNIDNETQDSLSTKAVYATEKTRISLEEDVDGDDTMMLEELQHLGDFDSNIAATSDEKIEMNIYENRQLPAKPGLLDKIPNNTRSVTVATASIVGLTMVVFLLTYAAFKWRQQRNQLRKDSFCEERIPSPVFETRKTNKHNSSSRSISPMLPSSNIYTFSSVDSRNGKESPDSLGLWDSLRKPFQ